MVKVAQTACERGRGERFEIGLTSQTWVEVSQAVRRVEQQRDCVTAPAQREHDLRAQPLGAELIGPGPTGTGRRSRAALTPHRGRPRRAWPPRRQARALPGGPGSGVSSAARCRNAAAAAAPPRRRATTLSREESDKVYERYHIPAPGSFVWAGPLANFTPGHQDLYVNFRNEDRAPLLFIAGGEDNLMPPAVNQSNAKHYRHTNSVTDYKEFPGRSHYTVGQDGWEEVADYALEWAVEHAKRPTA